MLALGIEVEEIVRKQVPDKIGSVKIDIEYELLQRRLKSLETSAEQRGTNDTQLSDPPESTDKANKKVHFAETD